MDLWTLAPLNSKWGANRPSGLALLKVHMFAGHITVTSQHVDYVSHVLFRAFRNSNDAESKAGWTMLNLDIYRWLNPTISRTEKPVYVITCNYPFAQVCFLYALRVSCFCQGCFKTWKPTDLENRQNLHQASVQPSVLCVTRVAVMVLMLECRPLGPGPSAVPEEPGGPTCSFQCIVVQTKEQ